MNLPRNTPVSKGEKTANVLIGIISAAIVVTVGMIVY